MKLIQKYLIVLPLFFAIIALSFNLTKPFIGHHDYTGVFNGMVARNYLEFGVWQLKFGQVPGFIGDINLVQSFYTHYLPLLPILIAFSFSIFGVVEWAERLVPTLFSLMGVFSLYLICKKVWNSKIGLMACFFFVFNPMFIYFGSMPVAEPVVLGMMLLSFYFYLMWLEKKSLKYLLLLSSSLFIGGLVGWPIIYLGPLLIFHSILLKKFNRQLIFPQTALLLSFFLIFFHAFILTGDPFGGGILATLKNRFAEPQFSFGGESFSFFSYIKKELSWWQAYFTRTLIILALFGLLSQLKSKNIQKITLLIFLLFGLSHISIFSRYVFVHDFLNIYLLPFLAIAGSLGVEKITNLLKKFGINKLVTGLIVFLIFIFFVFERLEFTKALLATNMNKKGLEMAAIINSIQDKPNQIAIISPRFGDFFGVFTNFYSKYSYIYSSEDDFKNLESNQKIHYIITIDQDVYDKDRYQLLTKLYSHKKIDDLTIFKIHE